MAGTQTVAVSISEGFLKKAIDAFEKQRPAAFNYAAGFAYSRRTLCRPINSHPSVAKLYKRERTIEPPLTIPGTGGHLGVGYSLQIDQVAFDADPATLPSNPLLRMPKDNWMRIDARFLFGFGYRVSPAGDPPPDDYNPEKSIYPRPIPGPYEDLFCFPLTVSVVVAPAWVLRNGVSYLGFNIYDFALDLIQPSPVERSIRNFIVAIMETQLNKMQISEKALSMRLSDYGSLTVVKADVFKDDAVEMEWEFS